MWWFYGGQGIVLFCVMHGGGGRRAREHEHANMHGNQSCHGRASPVETSLDPRCLCPRCATHVCVALRCLPPVCMHPDEQDAAAVCSRKRAAGDDAGDGGRHHRRRVGRGRRRGGDGGACGPGARGVFWLPPAPLTVAGVPWQDRPGQAAAPHAPRDHDRQAQPARPVAVTVRPLLLSQATAAATVLLCRRRRCWKKWAWTYRLSWAPHQHRSASRPRCSSSQQQPRRLPICRLGCRCCAADVERGAAHPCTEYQHCDNMIVGKGVMCGTDGYTQHARRCSTWHCAPSACLLLARRPFFGNTHTHTIDTHHQPRRSPPAARDLPCAANAYFVTDFINWKHAHAQTHTNQCRPPAGCGLVTTLSVTANYDACPPAVSGTPPDTSHREASKAGCGAAQLYHVGMLIDSWGSRGRRRAH